MLRLLLGLLGIGLVVFSIIWGFHSYSPRYKEYSGREVFETESDYSDFKKALVDITEIKIDKISIMSSDPPILVEMKCSRVPLYVSLGYFDEEIVSNFDGWTILFHVFGIVFTFISTVCGRV